MILQYNLNIFTFFAIILNFIVSTVGVIISRKYMRSKDLKVKQIAIFFTSNLIIVLGFLIIFWVLPLAIYKYYIR